MGSVIRVYMPRLLKICSDDLGCTRKVCTYLHLLSHGSIHVLQVHLYHWRHTCCLLDRRKSIGLQSSKESDQGITEFLSSFKVYLKSDSIAC